MRFRQLALAVAGLSLVTGAAMAGQASADVQGKPQPSRAGLGQAVGQPQTKAQAGAACDVAVGATTATGLNGGYHITATKPVTADPFNQYKLFATRASSSWYLWKGAGTVTYYAGFVVSGQSLYATAESYKTQDSPPVVSSKRLGSGWTGFSALASSSYYSSTTGAHHQFLYGLHANGSLYRYSINGPTGPVSAYGKAAGYQSFKAITVISQTPTYDTLLATTKQGALWTIHLPVTPTLKGTLKLVRTTGFAAYNQIIAQRCGTSGTLLTGFNNTANTGTVYALSKANGSKTVINTIGGFAAPQDAPTHYLYTGSAGPQLVGE